MAQCRGRKKRGGGADWARCRGIKRRGRGGEGRHLRAQCCLRIQEGQGQGKPWAGFSGRGAASSGVGAGSGGSGASRERTARGARRSAGSEQRGQQQATGRWGAASSGAGGSGQYKQRGQHGERVPSSGREGRSYRGLDILLGLIRRPGGRIERLGPAAAEGGGGRRDGDGEVIAANNTRFGIHLMRHQLALFAHGPAAHATPPPTGGGPARAEAPKKGLSTVGPPPKDIIWQSPEDFGRMLEERNTWDGDDEEGLDYPRLVLCVIEEKVDLFVRPSYSR
ncbi:hypothetical protein B0H13DRAFT_1850932 [Mycena leptocephala]|nr:hypothetical protein B0H13DRAFT_1850932 [Mycena leptocephala]